MKNTIYILIILGLVILLVFTCNRKEVHYNHDLQEQINQQQLIIDLQNGNIAMLTEEINTAYKVIDGLQEVPEKVRIIYMDKIRIIDGFSHAETTEGLSRLLNVQCGLSYTARHTIFERDTFLLINYQHANCFLKLEADRDKWQDLSNVYEALNVQYETVIEKQTGIIAAQDTIIQATEKKVDVWEHAYNESQEQVKSAEKRVKLWKGVTVVSAVLNILLLIK